jgi:hypothetical protein
MSKKECPVCEFLIAHYCRYRYMMETVEREDPCYEEIFERLHDRDRQLYEAYLADFLAKSQAMWLSALTHRLGPLCAHCLSLSEMAMRVEAVAALYAYYRMGEGDVPPNKVLIEYEKRFSPPSQSYILKRRALVRLQLKLLAKEG